MFPEINGIAFYIVDIDIIQYNLKSRKVIPNILRVISSYTEQNTLIIFTKTPM